MKNVIEAIVLFAVFLGIYLFFAGEVSMVEVIAGTVNAVLATALAAGLVAVAKKHFRMRPPVKAVLRPLAALLPEFFSVGRQLSTVIVKGASAQIGDFVHQPFDFGGDDAASTARRALTVIGVSMAPRSFVIRGENDQSLLLHTLPEKRPSTDTAWPA